MNLRLSLPLLDAEQRDGLKRGLLIGLAALTLAVPPALRHVGPSSAPALATAEVPPPAQPQFGEHEPSPDAHALASAVLRSGDHGGRPFALVDKRDARLYVFTAAGRLAGTTPILLGYAAGDDTVPGIGDRPIEQVQPHERTTPAGRFVADRGRNALGDHVVWVDYAAAVSMHPVRLTNPGERRQQRLDSPTVTDNRISYGCINIPPAFFAEVLWPHFRTPGNAVYVLPEVKPLTQVFPRLLAA